MSTRGGPRPTPTALKVVRGSRIRHDEPQAPIGDEVPSAPTWLSDAGRDLWNTLAPSMHASRLLTLWDAEAFAVYCEAVIRHREACKVVQEKGVMLGRVKNPALQIVRDTAATIRSYSQEFGLTPSARASINLPPAADEDEAARLLA
jgi:P27 family predicted phage terminase small subunit